VPGGCKRVLEVGCGDGRIAHAVSLRFGCLVVGFDLSPVALAKLALPKCCGSAAQLPFRDASFDVVMATEMLEHLPETLYRSVLTELQRVSSRHILITVPNQENLKEATVACGACGKRFHKWGHMRNYTPSALESMMKGFRLVRVSPFGGREPRYNRLLLWLRQEIARDWFWDEDTVCRHCGASRQPAARFPLLGRICDALNARIWAPLTRKETWLLAIYARK
jgi:SAM-dependent methyltransferase